jgi:hypothetical protein
MGEVPRAFLTTTPGIRRPTTDAFLHGLRELGYVEGRDIAIEWRTRDASRCDRLRTRGNRPMRLDMTSLSSAARDLIDDQLPALSRLAVALRAGQADDGIAEVDLGHGGAYLDALIGDVLRLGNDLAQRGETARRTGQYGEHYGEADRVVDDWLAVLVDERERLHVGGHAGEIELRAMSSPCVSQKKETTCGD